MYKNRFNLSCWTLRLFVILHYEQYHLDSSFRLNSNKWHYILGDIFTAFEMFVPITAFLEILTS